MYDKICENLSIYRIAEATRGGNKKRSRYVVPLMISANIGLEQAVYFFKNECEMGFAVTSRSRRRKSYTCAD